MDSQPLKNEKNKTDIFFPLTFLVGLALMTDFVGALRKGMAAEVLKTREGEEGETLDSTGVMLYEGMSFASLWRSSIEG